MLSEIVKMKDKIEDALPSVYVDANYHSIVSYCRCYPKIFDFDGETVTRQKNSDLYFEEPTISYFNYDLDKSTTESIIQLL